MRTKLIALAFTTGLSLLAGIQTASAGVSLFKDFTYGTPIERFSKAAGYSDCSNPDHVGRCTEGVEFLGQKFSAGLFFREGRLSVVALLAPYKQSLYQRVTDALSKSFNLVSMENEKSLIDMVALRNTATQAEFVAQYINFENAARASGDITYTYLEVFPSSGGFADMDAILKAAPEDVRTAAIRIYDDAGGGTLVVRFELPNISLKSAEGADESF